jgi:hypothetical protein
VGLGRSKTSFFGSKWKLSWTLLLLDDTRDGCSVCFHKNCVTVNYSPFKRRVTNGEMSIHLFTRKERQSQRWAMRWRSGVCQPHPLFIASHVAAEPRSETICIYKVSSCKRYLSTSVLSGRSESLGRRCTAKDESSV